MEQTKAVRRIFYESHPSTPDFPSNTSVLPMPAISSSTTHGDTASVVQLAPTVSPFDSAKHGSSAAPATPLPKTTSPFRSVRPSTQTSSPLVALKPAVKASPFGRAQSAAPVMTRTEASSSRGPKELTLNSHGHSYNTYPISVPTTNEDLSAFLYNPFNLPCLASFTATNTSTYTICCDTVTFHNWHIDASQLDLSLFRFIAIEVPIHTTLFKTLDCINPLYQNLFISQPSSYFLLYQFALHFCIFQWFSLQASICDTLDCRVPPHVHFTNNQCQRVFVIHDALSTSLNNILHFTFNALSSAIFDTDFPDTHLYIFYSIFTYSSRLITAKVDWPASY